MNSDSGIGSNSEKYRARLLKFQPTSKIFITIKRGIKKLFGGRRKYNVLIFISLLFILDRVFPPFQIKDFSKTVYASDGTLLTGYLTSDQKWRMRTRLSELTPEFKKAILLKEDKWFYWHPGVNPVALLRASIQNLLAMKVVSGASTITMQVCRMLSPAERNLVSKVIEIIRAIQMELHYSKEEIFELYCSLLPFGGNIEGVKSASYIYFNRGPGKLSLAQSVALCIIPNNPNKYRIDRDSKFLLEKRNSLLRQFETDGSFDKKLVQAALDEPLLQQRFTLPHYAPHFSAFVAGTDNNDIVETTLNIQIQNIVERLLKNYVNRWRGLEINNGAVIVLDNRNSSVTAYCGSSDYSDSINAGQVDGVRAIRSPGSTLKPFLYALALDEGIITPKSRISDIPENFAGYEPENYDRTYKGEVTNEYALVNSLNIPAVHLLKNIGVVNFISLLERGGVSEIAKQKKSLGLSMILGGCGVSLWSLTNLYAVFSREGYFTQVRYLKRQFREDVKRTPIFSSAASWLTAKALLMKNEYEKASAYQVSPKIQFAKKTGTSFGKKDAWAIGFSAEYTIGVWLGNFSGKGSPYLSGAEMAVPLLTELFNAIGNKQEEWFPKPKEVSMREVCRYSGLLPGEYCETEQDYFISGRSNNTKCQLEKKIYVDKKNSNRYCINCLPDSGYAEAIYRFYPAELWLWYQKSGNQPDAPPPHNPACIAMATESTLKITSPVNGNEYLIDDASPSEILLEAASEPGNSSLSWYINNKYYATTNNTSRIFWKPVKGKITITCMDDKARTASVTITVKKY